MDFFEYKDGRLFCEDIPAAEIAERFGTPAYIYSQRTLIDHYDRLAGAFGELKPLICYSVKSSGNIHILRALVERGAGLDVVSGGELERAYLAGCPMDRIVYAGVGKSDAEIMACLDGRHSLLLDGPSGGAGSQPSISSPPGGAGFQPANLHTRGPIAYFNIESEPEFENIAAIARRMGVRAKGALRVNPDVDPRTHIYTSTGKKETKFGVDIERAIAFFDRYARDEHLALDAIHLHIGSPVYDIDPYTAAVGKALTLIDELGRRGHTVRALDLGGGFGADYESGRSPAPAAYAKELVPLLEGRVRRGLKIILEPGRTISGNAGLLLTRVLYVKEGGAGKRFIICDAGMHTLIRPALYGSFHFIWPAEPGPAMTPPKRTERVELPGLSPADIVGPICESGDFLAKDRHLPAVQRGDLIAVFTAGAYGFSMSSNYNTQPLPAEVMVNGKVAWVIRARQSVSDLLRPELGAGLRWPSARDPLPS
jgi:diaminopimelate decarboxylase